METVVDWIKAHKWKSAWIIVALFFIPLIVVHFLFKWHSGNHIFEAEWSAGDLITYIAGFETFLGTVALGALALWQNVSLQNHQRKYDEERENLASDHPYFIIDGVYSFGPFDMKKIEEFVKVVNTNNVFLGKKIDRGLCLTVKNIGNGLALNIHHRYSDDFFYSGYNDETILADKVGNIIIPNRDDAISEAEIIHIPFTYKNIRGFAYQQNLTITCNDAEQYTFKNDENGELIYSTCQPETKTAIYVDLDSKQLPLGRKLLQKDIINNKT